MLHGGYTHDLNIAGMGTMIGWKRIVITIGEKIGRTHLSYAQGAVANLMAARTIGLSSYLVYLSVRPMYFLPEWQGQWFR
jgi:hypothetical protein